MTKLFVAGFPWSVTNDQLKEMFSPFGNVISAQVIMDRATGRSKGFGFVEFENDAEAQTAIEKLNGTQVEGRNLVVNVARPREERPAGGRSDRY